ncbi:hypothetical protein CI109_106710 [Kwoniella shandongensis]|uniref:Gfo/Idh/MocA-like oxidoreductase N-terminal domain-containing protein n=1 Tax=Kwoniella shandongensis TaxID=1734106 RepID=A0AAJ8LQU8_9TREE
MVISTMSPVSLIIVGAGQRGAIYANFAQANPHLLTVVGVADPRPLRLHRIADKFDISSDKAVDDWRKLLALGKFADAVVIGLLDKDHLEAVKAFAPLKYDILCEKYSPYNVAIKQVIDSGVIGDIVNIQHIEPVGFEHFAHSYVRGNWNKESDTSFSLMTKCCHDIDILNFFLSGKDGADRLKNYPTRVSSFGSLKHFRPSNKPAEAKGARRCTECPYEPECQFSAKKVYLDQFYRPDRIYKETRAKHFVENDVLSPETIMPYLETGPFGECVYNGQNDVCDNQVVNIEYASGTTASMTMIAFSDSQTECDRITRIHGTRGQIVGNMRTFDVFDFVTKESKHFAPKQEGKSHGGGDAGVSRAFAAAVSMRDQTLLGVTPEDVLMSHLLVFAAEKSRRSGTVVDFKAFEAESGSIVQR